MEVAKRIPVAGVLLLALIAGGCSQSAAQRTADTETPRDASKALATLAATPAPADLGGNWSVEWCDRSQPDLDCGGFNVTLVQDGEKLCGDYGGALVNQRQVDEGDIVGTVVGNTAVLAVESGRNGMIALVRAELHGGALHWREVDNIRRGDTDTAVIATDDTLAAVQSERSDLPRRCGGQADATRGG
ncbi:hypothetical protein ACW5F0_00635 [Luteimonas sp. A534]